MDQTSYFTDDKNCKRSNCQTYETNRYRSVQVDFHNVYPSQANPTDSVNRSSYSCANFQEIVQGSRTLDSASYYSTEVDFSGILSGHSDPTDFLKEPIRYQISTGKLKPENVWISSALVKGGEGLSLSSASNLRMHFPSKLTEAENYENQTTGRSVQRSSEAENSSLSNRGSGSGKPTQTVYTETQLYEHEHSDRIEPAIELSLDNSSPLETFHRQSEANTLDAANQYEELLTQFLEADAMSL